MRKIITFRQRCFLAAFLVAFIAIFTAQAAFDAATLPKLGSNLSSPVYYSPLYNYTNLLKQSNAFMGATATDAAGWPTAGPGGGSVYGLIFVDNENAIIEGNYTVTWEGDGDVSLSGTLVSEDLSGTIKKRVYAIVQNKAGIKISVNTFPANYAKNIDVRSPGTEYITTTYHPLYIKLLKPMSALSNNRGVVRFMDWGKTNNNAIQSTWSQRRSPYAITQSGDAQGQNVSWEYMITLCNEVGVDMYICVPHAADNTYVTNLAHLIKTGYDNATGLKTCEPLKPELRVWVEYSNEVWNYGFSQTGWVSSNNVFPGGTGLNWNYGKRAEQIMVLVEAELPTSRLVRIIAGQSANPWMFNTRTAAVPMTHFDVGSCSSYYSHDADVDAYNNGWTTGWNTPTNNTTGYTNFFNTLNNRIGTANTAFKTSGDTYQTNMDKAEHIAKSNDLGLPFIGYEGGSHLVKRATQTGTDIYEFLEHCHRDQRMIDSYKRWISRWVASGAKTHLMYQEAGLYGEYGHWGHCRANNDLDSWETGATITALRHYARYKAMLDYFALPYPATFQVGTYLTATPATQTILTAGGTKSFAITVTGENATGTVTVSSSASWLTASVSGSNINVSAGANASYQRTALVSTFVNGVLVNKLSVTQEGLPLNKQPTINQVAGISIAKGVSSQTVTMTGITDGDGNTQTISISAASDNTGLIPTVNVNYVSGATTGTLVFTPISTAVGTATITVTVTDNGGTGGGGVNTKTMYFNVIVMPPRNSALIEAEDFNAALDVTVSNQHTGYTGTGYADFGSHGVDTWSEYQLNVLTAGDFDFMAKYSNGDTGWANRNCNVYVNGVKQGTFIFPAIMAGDWTMYEYSTIITMPLTAGLNTVKLQLLTGATKGPNVDHIAYAPKGTNVEAPTVKDELAIQLYPNPVVDKLAISGLEQSADIRVMKMDGALVYQLTAERNIERIDLSSLDKGLYVLTVESNNKKSSFKLIKN